jgi:asparagine synthase (glutamine-hydrolysing)
LESLLKLPEVPRGLNSAYVAAHLLDATFHHQELTFFAGVKKLPPAHCFTVRANSVEQQRYWHPADARDVRFSSDAEYVEAFLEIFHGAVHTRLRGAEAVGAHVTGGLDSSSIAVLASHQLQWDGKSLTGFCWEPPPGGAESTGVTSDERRLIAAVSEQESLPIRYQRLTADDVVAVLRRNVMHQPICNTLVHEQLVQRQAEEEGIDVILSGWGGDESVAFNGRGYLPELLLSRQWDRLYQISKERSPHPWRYVLRRALLPLAPAAVRDCIRSFRNQSPIGRYMTDFLRPEVIRDLKSAAAPLLAGSWREVGVRKTQLQLLELGHLTHRMESWAASGGRHHIQYRYPLLDIRVVEFAVGLPPEQYVNGAWSRYLMRVAISDFVPRQVSWNRDKSDPARSQMLAKVTGKAYSKAAQYLAERGPMVPGSEYVDVERLLRRLASDQPIAGDESDHIWRRLQFIDF